MPAELEERSFHANAIKAETWKAGLRGRSAETEDFIPCRITFDTSACVQKAKLLGVDVYLYSGTGWDALACATRDGRHDIHAMGPDQAVYGIIHKIKYALEQANISCEHVDEELLDRFGMDYRVAIRHVRILSCIA